MPNYRLVLEATIVCPDQPGRPELTLSMKEVRDSLLYNSSYAVCAPPSDDPLRGKKLTASLRITSVSFPDGCPCCGSKGAA